MIRQETQPFLMAMAVIAHRDDPPIQGVESRKQSCGSVPLIVMNPRAAPALFQRQSRLSAVQRLNLALLVNAQHYRVLGRIQVEPDDIGKLPGKLWITADLEGPRQVWLQAVGAPDTAYGSLAHARSFRHAAGTPLRGVGWLARRRQFYDPRRFSIRHRPSASRSRCILQESFFATVKKAISPASNFFRSYAELGGDFLVLQAIGCAKDDARTLYQPRRKRPPPGLLFQHGAILRTQLDFPCNAHQFVLHCERRNELYNRYYL
jgi:hypothetical protein